MVAERLACHRFSRGEGAGLHARAAPATSRFETQRCDARQIPSVYLQIPSVYLLSVRRVKEPTPVSQDLNRRHWVGQAQSGARFFECRKVIVVGAWMSVHNINYV
jgi:hypothetical protein